MFQAHQKLKAEVKQIIFNPCLNKIFPYLHAINNILEITKRVLLIMKMVLYYVN